MGSDRVLTREGQGVKKEGVQYLAVPYREKGNASRAGACWDKKVRFWYVPEGTSLDGLVRWLPAKNREPAADVSLAVRSEFAVALRNAGFALDGLPQMDGTLQRVKVDGDRGAKRSGTYVGFLDGHPAGYINNFKTGVQMNWKSQVPVAAMSERDRIALRLEAMQREIRRADRRLKIQAAAAERSRRALAAARLAPGDHAYLIRKGLEGNPHGLKLDRFGNLLLAAQDGDGNVRSLQRISPDGHKLFTKGGRMDGSHALLLGVAQGFGDGDTLIIAEGYATAATIERSTHIPVAVAFNAGNLLAVAESYRHKCPTLHIVIAGDNDHLLPLQIAIDGQPKKNVGKEKAELAAQAVGGYALLPLFNPGEEGSDWNDFEQLRGRDETRQTLVEGVAMSRIRIDAHQINNSAGEPVTAPTPNPQNPLKPLFSVLRRIGGHGYSLTRDEARIRQGDKS